jgi:hypothetical protein
MTPSHGHTVKNNCRSHDLKEPIGKRALSNTYPSHGHTVKNNCRSHDLKEPIGNVH